MYGFPFEDERYKPAGQTEAMLQTASKVASDAAAVYFQRLREQTYHRPRQDGQR